jgi:hypothetical protein
MLALSGVEDELVVSWVTWVPSSSQVKYSTDNKTFKTASGSSITFIDTYNYNITRYIHTVLLQNLTEDTMYLYRVGSTVSNIWSDLYATRTISHGDKILNMIVYGDFGLVNHQSLNYLIDEVNTGNVDIILHNGDYAYDLFTNNGTYGDQFLNMIQPLGSSVPYMGSVGNHEMKYNGSHYTNRFALYNYAGMNSGSQNNWWYSWDYISGGAKVHMVAISTEVYYVYVDQFPPPNLSPQVQAQWEWLKQDLAAARKNSDWVIVYGHRPLYCSDVDDIPDCTSDAQVLRDGVRIPNDTAPAGTYAMDQMLGLNKVDIYIGAHEHSYERLFPVFQGKVDYPKENHTYVNPKYPVHLVLGAAGNQEYFDYFDEVFYGPWSAARSASYGYGFIRVYNESHLHFTQLIAEGEGGSDDLWIVKN